MKRSIIFMFAILGMVFMSFTPAEVTKKAKETTTVSFIAAKDAPMPAVNVHVNGELQDQDLVMTYQMMVDPIQFNNLSHIRAMVEYPGCIDGATVSHQPLGSNFVKNTCFNGGAGGAHEECFAYSPYANGGSGGWQKVTCWPAD